MTDHSAGFTGRHMALIMTSFFGVVIGVNVTMAVYASSSWSGLVVQNTYVASQEFNRKAAAMKAMAASGIRGLLSLKGGAITYTIRNRDGSPAEVDRVHMSFKRPVGDHEDFQIDLVRTAPGRFEANHAVAAGDWIVETLSQSGDMLVMHEAARIDTAGEGQ